MDGPFLVQFVDQISATPTLRLDVCGDIWSLTTDSDLSPPALERAYAGSLLADGRPVTSAAYGNRLIRLELLLAAGASEDQAAIHVQRLGQELSRPANILRWQPGTSQPVFFRTLRGEFGKVYWDPVEKRCSVLIPAEPFAYGVRELLPSATVSPDPAAATNGCYWDITGVKGDVETPLILRVPGTALAGLTSVLATRRRGTPSAAAFLAQAETLTLQTDTTLPGNDALMSGTGSNYTRTSFATITTMRTRVNGVVSALPASVDMRGTYRVLARMRHSIAADIIQVRLTWGQGITKTANDAVTLHTTGAVDATGLHYYDLGLLQMPPGADPVHDGYSGVELAVDPSQITVDAARVSGSGNLDIDHLLILPADDRLLLVTWPSPAGDQLVLDGTHEMVVSMLTTGSTRIYGPPPASLSGGFPMISPSVTNRIYFIRRVNSGLVGADVLTSPQVFSPEYYPRYLFVRPVAS